MIERVAKAIFDEGKKPSQKSESDKDLIFRFARAAIAAMREPTGAMYMAGGIVAPSAHLADKKYKPYGTKTIGDMAAKAAWEKMIDTALEEKK